MRKARTISVVLLTLLVVLSSTSMKLDLHFCKGKIKDWALLTSIKSCEAHQKPRACNHCKKELKETKGCCEDQSVVKEGGEQIVKDHVSLLPANDFTVILFALVVEPFLLSDVASPEYYNYSPPLLSFDINVRIQSLLI